MVRWIAATIFALTLGKVNAQSLDSLHIEVGSSVQVASSRFQPLWVKANRFGKSSDEQFDQVTWLEATNKQDIGELRFLSADRHPLSFRYGAAVFNANHYGRTVLQQAFAELRNNKIVIRGGRHKDLWDDLDPQLSAGSLGTSGNALPVPKITGAIIDYVNIPLTNGFLQFKGSLSHGWLGSNRFMESFLHEKTLYGRINLGKWKLYGGIQHYTEWGGQRPSERLYLDRSFKGFLDVLFVKEANDGSLPSNLEEKGVRPNRAGDQRGLLEYGAKIELENINLHIYNQTPFESGTGVDIRNIDRLLGLHVKFKNEYALLTDLVIEFIYTKQMEEFGKESQSYYNNGVMKTGWEYEDNIIGIPLFTNRQQASNYFPINPFDWRGTAPISGNDNIINNRIVGLNLASRWEFLDNWGLFGKITPVMNYGARNYQQFYKNGKGLFQCYSILEGFFQHRMWTYTFGVAGDFGQLYSNVGATAGIKYSVGL